MQYSLIKADRLKNKQALKKFYLDAYLSFKEELILNNIKTDIIEIGSGTTLIQEIVPEATLTDVIDFPGRDMYLDCTQMPFQEKSINAFFMLNVLHHVGNKEDFFEEVNRCLKQGGILFIRDQYISPLSRFIYKYLHNEKFDEMTTSWNFVSHNPVVDANGAIPHLIFHHDLGKFQCRWPHLKVMKIKRTSSLFYWLSGGLKKWTLIPGFSASLALMIDKQITRLTPWFCSFMDIVIIKQ